MMTKPSYLPLKRECEVAAFLPLPCNNASRSSQYPIVLSAASGQIAPVPRSNHPASKLTPHLPLNGTPGLTILPPQRIYPQPLDRSNPQITEIQYLPCAAPSRYERLRTQLGSYLQSLLQIALGVIAGVSLMKIPSGFLPGPAIHPMLGELTNNPLLKGAFPVSGVVGETPATAIKMGGTLEGTLTAQNSQFPASFAPPPAMAPVAMDRFYLAPNAAMAPDQTAAINSMVVVDRFYFPNLVTPGRGNRESPNPTLPAATVIPGSGPFQNVAELSPIAADQGLSSTEVADSDAYILAGVMELGNQSTALFHQGNRTYSIRLGERIGASDWVLASISAGRAVLMQGGETRVLRVGEALLNQPEN